VAAVDPATGVEKAPDHFAEGDGLFNAFFIALPSGVCQDSWRISLKNFEYTFPYFFHGPLDNESLTACVQASPAPPILKFKHAFQAWMMPGITALHALIHCDNAGYCTIPQIPKIFKFT
jgi:hypothetical protein